MKLFNTLTKEYKDFKPISKEITIYHCGPTVYSRQHIGNMRSVVIGDIINRTMRLWAEIENEKLTEAEEKYTVSYVRNYTDVGHLTGDNIGDADAGIDRMEKATNAEQLSPDEIANKYIKQYNDDVQLLGTLPPADTPRATEYISEMSDMVSVLLNEGIAYRTELAIYFNISKKPDYTKLSRQNLDELLSGHGHGEVSDSEKKNQGDFAIWFFKKGTHSNALQTWDFMGESGFPGWHIECSAMIKKLLGDTIDIHIGGIEHIPIHHTNEIAQSECANHAPLATYWLHNEHLLVDNKKMSKSEGTSYTLEDIMERGYKPEHLRFFFLQAHYRSKQNFTWDALEAAKNGYERILRKLSENTHTEKTEISAYQLIPNLHDSLFTDFNIPQVLAVLFEMDFLDILSREQIFKLDNDLLGLNLEKNYFAIKNTEIPKYIIEIADTRMNLRKQKDWTNTDSLRELINSHGYEIKDFTDNSYIITPIA